MVHGNFFIRSKGEAHHRRDDSNQPFRLDWFRTHGLQIVRGAAGIRAPISYEPPPKQVGPGVAARADRWQLLPAIAATCDATERADSILRESRKTPRRNKPSPE